MMKLVQIAEGKIRDELKSTKGAIMYDGWTENGVHYVGIYVVYNRTFGLYRNGVLETESELAITLLSVRHFEDVFYILPRQGSRMGTVPDCRHLSRQHMHRRSNGDSSRRLQ